MDSKIIREIHLGFEVPDMSASRLTMDTANTDMHSDSGCSEFDDEYFKNKPPPLYIPPHQKTLIKANNELDKPPDSRNNGDDKKDDILSQPQMMKVSKATQTAKLDLATDVNLRPLIDSIIRSQAEHSICLQEIKQIIVKEEHESEVEKVSFKFNLPCDSLETLESLESYVHAHRSQFVKFLQKIGGNDGRDFTCRCMKTIFTNSLGEICLWTGQKSNYPASNLKFMELMFDVVHKKSSITKWTSNYMSKNGLDTASREERETTKERENEPCKYIFI